MMHSIHWWLVWLLYDWMVLGVMWCAWCHWCIVSVLSWLLGMELAWIRKVFWLSLNCACIMSCWTWRVFNSWSLWRHHTLCWIVRIKISLTFACIYNRVNDLSSITTLICSLSFSLKNFFQWIFFLDIFGFFSWILIWLQWWWMMHWRAWIFLTDIIRDWLFLIFSRWVPWSIFRRYITGITCLCVSKNTGIVH